MALPYTFTAVCKAKGTADAAGGVFVIFSTVASANIRGDIPIVFPVLAASHHADFEVGQTYEFSLNVPA